MDFDKLIAKMERDLESLRRARELARRYDDDQSTTGRRGNGASSAEPEAADAWYQLLPDLLREQPMSIRQIETTLGQKGIRVAYSTIHSWMKRAVARGDFKKKSSKYRWQEAKDQHTA